MSFLTALLLFVQTARAMLPCEWPQAAPSAARASSGGSWQNAEAVVRLALKDGVGSTNKVAFTEASETLLKHYQSQKELSTADSDLAVKTVGQLLSMGQPVCCAVPGVQIRVLREEQGAPEAFSRLSPDKGRRFVFLTPAVDVVSTPREGKGTVSGADLLLALGYTPDSVKQMAVDKPQLKLAVISDKHVPSAPATWQNVRDSFSEVIPERRRDAFKEDFDKHRGEMAGNGEFGAPAWYEKHKADIATAVTDFKKAGSTEDMIDQYLSGPRTAVRFRGLLQTLGNLNPLFGGHGYTLENTGSDTQPVYRRGLPETIARNVTLPPTTVLVPIDLAP